MSQVQIYSFWKQYTAAVFQNLKVKYLVHYFGDFMSDFWVLPVDKGPSPVRPTVPSPYVGLFN